MTDPALTLEQAMTLADDHHRAGRWQDAESHYRAVLRQQPSHAGANHRLGLLAIRRGKAQLGLEHLKTALEADPGQAQHWFSLVEALLATGQSTAAGAMLDQGVRRGLSGPAVDALRWNIRQSPERMPDQADSLVGSGNRLMELGRIEEAATHYRQALALRPDHTDAHHNLGAALVRQGRFDDAAASYRRALALKPNHPLAHINLASALLSLDRPEEAVASYRRGLELRPDHAVAHNNLGSTLLRLGKFEEATASLGRALALKPDDSGSHFNLGNALVSLGRLDEGAANYRRSLQLDPNNADGHNNLGSVLLRLGKFDDAVASYRSALKLRPDGYAHHNLGEALKRAGNLKEAVEHFRLGHGRDTIVKALEGLYEIGDIEQYKELIADISQSEPNNIGIAAVSCFVSHQWSVNNTYPFCKNPMNFIRLTNISSELAESGISLEGLAKALSSLDAEWEPLGISTRNGFQTNGNLFDLKLDGLGPLKKMLFQQTLDYKAAFSSEDCGMIGQWQDDFTLTGWCVRLLKGGHQEAHIHPGGWLSGVFYVKMPRELKDDEGAIEFGLQGPHHRVVDNAPPTTVRRLRDGDVVIFPSSLFHKTIPFSSDEERICIGFDLVPAKSEWDMSPTPNRYGSE